MRIAGPRKLSPLGLAGLFTPRRSGVPALLVIAAVGLLTGSCGGSPTSQPPPSVRPSAVRPSILLVTLDTTRADVVGPEAQGIETTAFNGLASRGRRFRQAYATVPETLPSHASMMTGLYAGGHGIHENGRHLAASYPVLTEKLQQAGYRTAAFVSSFILARRFGLARGFDLYDDELPPNRSERSAKDTTDAVVAMLAKESKRPLLLWVHYFDPHAPYEPPEPFRSRFPGKPYLGEVAAMDAQIGRLVQAFEQWAAGGPTAIVAVGDHGEGLGEHGELLHGNLLYQSTMHVPLVIAGPGVAPAVTDRPVSARRVFHTVLDFAGVDSAHSLREAEDEVVVGEAMKPFLSYGWQPQVMAVDGREKSILAGRVETYDVIVDPGESRDLAADPNRHTSPPAALRDYPVPSPAAARTPASVDADAQRRLASLGYVSAGAAPVVRKGAPRPADMVGLFALLEAASDLFVNQRYREVVPLLEEILKHDPYNLDAVLRLATAHSSLGHGQRALDLFRKAAEIAPQSQDVRTYLALHLARGQQWERAVPLLEQIVTESPERLPALEALAVIRERQGRVEDAIGLRQKIYAMRAPTAAELVQLGMLLMDGNRTPQAIDAFERARSQQGNAFSRNLELGVLYLDAHRFEDARAALDRVPPSHPGYAMALFKRAQVSVLLHESDAAARIARARERADRTTRELIARERLFQTVRIP